MRVVSDRFTLLSYGGSMKFRLFAGLLLLCASMAFAQSDRGTITGTVSDASKAVVPNAAVVATNTQTAARYETASTETGNYTLTQLPVGTYSLTVEQPGFKKYIRQGITVLVAQTLRVDVQLELGAVSEEVQVTADAPLLRTESGDLSHNISTERLDNLPVLGIGAASAGTTGIRNPISGIQLIPGTYYLGAATLRINGAPQNTYSVRVEGQEASNSNYMFQTAQVQPSVDAIQEVSIQTSNYAAEYGQAGGGFINYTMKSGTNQYHGLAYDNIVNEALNSGTTRTLLNGEHQRDRQRRHDYGFSLSGPAFLPKIYNGHDKTFFFFNFEQFREINGVGTNMITVPTAAYRAGDFSQVLTGKQLGTDPLGRPIMEGTIYDPATTRTVTGTDGKQYVVRDPFPNNKIDPARFDKVAANILNLIPPPINSNVTLNYNGAYNGSRVTTIPGVKVDQILGKAKISFYASFTDTKGKDISPLYGADGLPDPITQSLGSFTKSHTESLNVDYTVSPRLLWHVGLGYQHYNLNAIPKTTWDGSFPNLDVAKIIGLNGTTYNYLFPQITGLTAARGGMAVMGPGNANSLRTIKPSVNTSATWIKGSHTYKFGAEFRIEGSPEYQWGRTGGVLTFATAETGLPYVTAGSVSLGGGSVGFPFASFLLGLVDNGDLGSPVDIRYGKHIWAFYAQDSWKVTQRLTIDYGLRYDYSNYLREQYGRLPNLSPTLANPSASGYPGASIFEGSGPGRCNCDFAKNYPYAFGPRVGAAWRMTSKDVLRLGWGISYQAFNGRPPFGSTNPFISTTPGKESMVLQNGFPYTSAQVAWPNYSAGIYPLIQGTLNGVPVTIDQNGGRPARMMQWSIGLQHQLTPNLVIEAAYVGNRGVWWPGDVMKNVNALTPDRLQSFGLDATNLTDRTLLGTPLNRLTGANAARFPAPYASFPLTATVAQSLRPFPQFTNITSYWAPVGNTWYDSLQAKVTKRFSHGLDFTGAFTWQKELQLGTEAGVVNDIFNRNQNKYISSMSKPLMLSMAGTYQLPQITKRKVLSRLLSEWRFGAVMMYSSGLPIQAPQAQNNLNSLMMRNVTTLSFANRIPGQALYLKDLNCNCIDPTTDFVLNPAAWSSPAAGQFGTGAAYYSDYRYQRRPSESMSLERQFRLTESGLQLEFRVQFTNIFNRGTLGDPSSTNAGATQVVTGGVAQSGFGYINPTALPPTGQGRPREGIFIAKLRF